MGMYCTVLAAPSENYSQFSGDPELTAEYVDKSAATANGVSLEKAWHGLHYLLTGQVWEGEGPAGFLLGGGKPLSDDEEAADRWFTPEETSDIHQALSAISDDELWSRFDADAMQSEEIYPCIWDEPEEDLKDEYLMYFNGLKKVVATASQNGEGLIVTIG